VRASLKLFGNEGPLSMPVAVSPIPEDRAPTVAGVAAPFESPDVNELRSIWRQQAEPR
jgi:hypothetical protein